MFRYLPETLPRIEAWLDRELRVLLGVDEDVELVKEFVMSLMRTYVVAIRMPQCGRRGAAGIGIANRRLDRHVR